VNTPRMHTLHCMNARVSVKNDRIVNELPTFNKTSLAIVGTSLEDRASRNGNDASNDFPVFMCQGGT